MIKQNRNIELTPVSPKPLEHIIKFKLQTSKFNVSALSKNDGLIRCATYNMAENLSQQPGDRKRKSPRHQNRYRSEIWGKSTAIFWIKNGAYPYGRTSTTYQKAALS